MTTAEDAALRLVSLLEQLACAEASIAIVEPLADDEPTRAHLAGLRQTAAQVREQIAEIVAVLPTYDAEWRRAAAGRLMATRTGCNADLHEHAAQILTADLNRSRP